MIPENMMTSVEGKAGLYHALIDQRSCRKPSLVIGFPLCAIDLLERDK
jgi:hypothetical protein